MKRFDRINFLGDLLSEKPIRECYVIQHLPRGPEVRQKSLAEVAITVEKEIATIGHYDKKFGRMSLRRCRDIGHCINVFYTKHLELDFTCNDLTEIGRMCGQLAIDYFFGDWRDGYADTDAEGKIASYWDGICWSREVCRQKMDWIDPFYESLICTFLVNDIDVVRRIAEWVDVDIWDMYLLDHTVEDAMFLTVLGKIIRGEQWKDCISIIEKITSSRRRRPKLLLPILESIFNSNDTDFSESIQKYVKHFIKNEVKIDEGFTGVISIYASLLWNYARLCKIELPILPEEIMDRIITPQSVGLVK
jgi:hypothetical protein